MMNKIIIDTDKYNLELREDTYLDIRNNGVINLKVIIQEKIKLIILNNSYDVSINIELFDNTNIEINSLGLNGNINYKVIQNNNTNLYIVSSIITKVNSINKIDINQIGNNNITKFYTNGINLSNEKLFFNIDGIIKKNVMNGYLEETSKIINLSDGDSKIIPNLIIDTKEVIANHSAFIGTFNNNDLNYLMSRGITKDIAYKLLIKSILLSNMKLDANIFIKEISDYIGIGGEKIE